MKQLLKVVALSTLCSLAACVKEKPVMYPIPIPGERIDCAVLIKRPDLTPEYKLDWATVEKAPTKEFAIQLAKLEVQKFMRVLRERELETVNYIVNIEGILFGCSSDAEWLREYTKKSAQ